MIIQCPQCSSRYNASMKTAGDSIHCRCGMDFHVPELPNLARSWNCPNCAGSVNPNKNSCDYCDAYLAFARCPACFSIAPYDEAKYCAECSESLTLPIRTPTKRNQKNPCPRCNHTLVNKIVDKHSVDLCSKCGGIWIEHHHLNKIMSDEPLNTNAILGKTPNKKTSKQLPRHRVSYLACPECNDLMTRHNFLRESNIIIDQCNTHGIWFDKYELAAGLHYLRSRRDRPVAFHINRNSKIESKEKNKHSSREDNETFEIQDEDLKLLLEEFPEWNKSKDV